MTKNYTIIRLNHNNKNRGEYVVTNEKGEIKDSIKHGNLNDISDQEKNNTVIIMLPGEEILSKSLILPIKSKAKLKQAIPFAMEDDIARDINDCHFAFEKSEIDESIIVNVIDRKLFKNYLNQLKEINISPSFVVSENSCVYKTEDTINLIIEDAKAHGRCEFKEPYTLDIMDLSNIIKALESNNNINHLQISLSKNNDSLVKQISELADTYKSVDTKILSKGAFQEFIKNYFVQDHVNLLQGDFKPKIKFEKVFKPWRTSLALSTFLLLSLLINNVLNMNKLVNYEADLSAYFLNEYKYFYNNARNVDDPIRIVNSIKNGAQLNMNNSIFLNGLNIISESVAKENNVQLSSISFTDNRFNLRLLTSTLTSLDSLITNINTNGSLNAIIQTTNQSDNKVESRIEIQVNL